MKAAVIGMGPHGRRVADVLRSLEGVELAAVVDCSAQALATADLPPEVARYRSDQELWSRGDVALVCVATNGPSHAALSLAAMEAGVRYLLVEKPMACSLSECDQMLAKARATQTRMAVDHTRRHAPGFQWLRGKIASGDWGQLRTIWIQRPGIGLACNGTHSFDAVAYLAGTAIRHVTAWIDRPIGKNPRGEQFSDPGGLVVMELAGGIRAIVAQIEDGAGPVAVEIDLTAARIRMDEQNGAIEIVERDLSVKPGPGRPAAFRRLDPPAGLSAKTEMAPLIRAGLVDLTSEQPLTTDATHGRQAVEVLIAAYLSERQGNARVALPLAARDDLDLWLPVT